LVRKDDKSSPNDTGLTERFRAFEKRLRGHARRLSRAKNLLAEIEGAEPSAKDFADWLALRDGLDGLDLGEPDLQQRKTELLEALDKPLERARLKARMSFVQKFEMRAKQAGLELEKLSESPLVFFADPLTIELDFDQASARLLFGKEPIVPVDMEAASVIEAYQDAVEGLEARAMESAAFFDLLLKAYRTVIVANSADDGDRVDLVDVLLPLGLLRVEREEWRDQEPDSLEPFGRVLLAFQLARLRREGVLERKGMRLDLGAATGGTTRDKKNVLFIPIGARDGQYYGSIRFNNAS
jgi:hypothetical protein